MMELIAIVFQAIIACIFTGAFFANFECFLDHFRPVIISLFRKSSTTRRGIIKNNLYIRNFILFVV